MAEKPDNPSRQKNATASFRFNDETKREIEWAAKVQRISQTAVVELAVQAYVRELRKQRGEAQPAWQMGDQYE